MAKKKARPKKVPAAPPPRNESFRLRMSDEFKAWLERFAAHRRLTTADTVEQGIVALAKAEGFEPPPRR